jgi:hypothetical protein
MNAASLASSSLPFFGFLKTNNLQVLTLNKLA